MNYFVCFNELKIKLIPQAKQFVSTLCIVPALI